MSRKRPRASGGFTLVELVITAAIASIVALAIGVVIVDSQSSWNAMYDRVNSDVVTDGYVARKKFDVVMRKASGDKLVLGDAGGSIEVYYYADASSTVVDRYARFYASDDDLNLEYGQLDPRVTLDVETVCANVSACTFKQVGRSIQMILTLDNGTHSNTVVSSAVTQNQ
ncbi:MAG: prepilin-type N-terminal cleavage/methylation domain-containing protein [Phycisphaerales bacterium]|nr:MAG: prepilin-type N-terminal cleavage/methylation domain-containing protein [Phycisphaerales bacterium]